MHIIIIYWARLNVFTGYIFVCRFTRSEFMTENFKSKKRDPSPDTVPYRCEDEKISGIVSQHMFLPSRSPSSMESGVVWFGDKIATVAEFFRAESLFQGDELWRKITEKE